MVISHQIYVCLFVVLLTLIFFAGYLNVRMFSHIKKKHITVWKKLGEPPFLFVSKSNSKLIRQFLKEKKYLDLNDNKLNSLIIRLRIVTRLAQIFFLVMVVLLFSFRIK